MAPLAVAAAFAPLTSDEDPAAPAAAMGRDGSRALGLAGGSGEPRLADGVRDVLTQCRERVLGRVLHINDLTASEVLAAGNTLSEIVACAQAQLAATREALRGTSGGGGVTELIDQQSQKTQAHLAGLCLALADQTKLAREAMTASASIAAIGSQVSNVATQTRLLSLNANIEAARLGHAGGAFQVIAIEMRRLTSEIEQANRRIGEMAETLVTLIPQVVSCADGLSERANLMDAELSASTSQVRAATGELRRAVTGILDNGEHVSGKILAGTYKAISHLQFQDPAAQGLLLIDADMAALIEHISGLLSEAGAGATSRPEGINLTPSANDSHAARHAGAVQVLDESPAVDAGEVLLF